MTFAQAKLAADRLVGLALGSFAMDGLHVSAEFRAKMVRKTAWRLWLESKVFFWRYS